jgi:hypothetical protein
MDPKRNGCEEEDRLKAELRTGAERSATPNLQPATFNLQPAINDWLAPAKRL